MGLSDNYVVDNYGANVDRCNPIYKPERLESTANRLCRKRVLS